MLMIIFLQWLSLLVETLPGTVFPAAADISFNQNTANFKLANIIQYVFFTVKYPNKT